MPDISMCNKTKCSKFTKCYRARATPSIYQCYCEFEYGPNGCDHYWAMDKHEILNTNLAKKERKKK